MTKIFSFLFCFLLISSFGFAQAHTYNVCCRLSKAPVTAECVCPGCQKEKDDEKKAYEEKSKQDRARVAQQQEENNARIKREQEEMAKAEEDRIKEREKNKITIGSSSSSSPSGGASQTSKPAETKKTETGGQGSVKTPSSSSEKKVITKEEQDASYLEFQRRQKESQAKSLETEGDQFSKMGSAFMGMALKKYQEAQSISYSSIVQVKIDKINATQEAVKLVNDGLDKIGDFADDMQSTMDSAGIKRWRVTSFTFEGLSPGFEGYQTQKILKPQSFSLTYGFYRLFAMEAGLTYYKSPVYKLGLEDNNRRYINKDIEGSYSSFGPEISIGLALPAKYFNVYAMYGYYFPFVIGATPYSYSDKYKLEGNFQDNFGVTIPISKLKFGAFISIPKTRIGIGLKYILNGINGEKLISGGGTAVSVANGTEYTIGHGNYNSVDKLKYNNIGISLLIIGR